MEIFEFGQCDVEQQNAAKQNAALSGAECAAVSGGNVAR
jgi:hypothetical protein